ncbi:unnamed protein product [Owenia fusiformis]|uniref:Uncharacterized protein n=1 Tax=Owenia fusiformis TaxID=6347 RepID=A0A8S4PJA6_OWEFU|nr:unnamed protein product [Owenia fusiformis]
MPQHKQPKLEPPKKVFVQAGGKPLHMQGVTQVEVNIGGHVEKLEVIVADIISEGILETDYLAVSKARLDYGKCKLTFEKESSRNVKNCTEQEEKPKVEPERDSSPILPNETSDSKKAVKTSPKKEVDEKPSRRERKRPRHLDDFVAEISEHNDVYNQPGTSRDSHQSRSYSRFGHGSGIHPEEVRIYRHYGSDKRSGCYSSGRDRSRSADYRLGWRPDKYSYRHYQTRTSEYRDDRDRSDYCAEEFPD